MQLGKVVDQSFSVLLGSTIDNRQVLWGNVELQARWLSVKDLLKVFAGNDGTTDVLMLRLENASLEGNASSILFANAGDKDKLDTHSLEGANASLIFL